MTTTWLGATSLLLLLGSCSLLRFAHGGDYSSSPYFRSPPAPWQESRELRVVTFNIKDMYWFSKRRAARMPAIGEVLADLQPDIVCLQEGYVAGDIAVIAAALRGIGIEHGTDFPSGVVGSGMWTFSRFPIRETFFLKFSKNGVYHDTRGGDWWAGKGVGLVRVEVAPGQLLDVYNTHMICNLGGSYVGAHRRVQVKEFANFVNSATPASIPALLLGDFNCVSGSREFEYLGKALMWERMLQKPSWYDHVYAYSLYGAYRFTPLAEVPILGRAGESGRTVSLSDHVGYLVQLRIDR